MKKRLDVILYEKGLTESREKARSLIMTGNVLVNNKVITKCGMKIDEANEIRLKKSMKYVGRGALKLIKALDEFKINPEGKICADIGASTGGFTQVLLERGAKLVYSIDVGTNQLAYKLRTHERVKVMEQTNAKDLKREMFDPLPELVVIDVSFISLTSVLLPVVDILNEKKIICLVKPQFEIGRDIPGFKGVVKENIYRLKALEKISEFITENSSLKVTAATYSPITGPKGNVEFFLYLTEAGNTVYFNEIVEAAGRELE